jgi:hypothetical protein
MVKGYDADPANNTFAAFKALNVSIINILDLQNSIDDRKYDILMDNIYSMNDVNVNGHVIIDSGTSCYVSLMSYLISNNAFKLLKESNNVIYIHVVIAGGGALNDCIECFDNLAKEFPGYPIIIWLNPFYGSFYNDDKYYKDFDHYKNNIQSINGIVQIPDKQKSTFGKDIELIMTKKITFAQAIQSNLPLMVRQRLKTFWNEISFSMHEICRFPSLKTVSLDIEETNQQKIIEAQG